MDTDLLLIYHMDIDMVRLYYVCIIDIVFINLIIYYFIKE